MKKEFRKWIHINDRTIKIEGSLFGPFNIGITINGDTQEVSFIFCIWLFSFYIAFEKFLPKNWYPLYSIDPKENERILKKYPNIIRTGSRELSISIYQWSISIYLLADLDSGYTKYKRDYHLCIPEFLFGKHIITHDTINTSIESINFSQQEKYKIKVKELLITKCYKRIRFIKKRHKAFDMFCEYPIPFPGKGTTSYNQGEDAIFSMYLGNVKTKEKALKRLRDDIIRYRIRGGFDPFNYDIEKQWQRNAEFDNLNCSI